MPVGRFKKPSRLRPGIPPSLDAVVMGCLEPRKEDRYPDAAVLRAALKGNTKRRAKTAWAMVIGGLVMVAVVTGGVYYRLKEKPAPVRANLSSQESTSPAKPSTPPEALPDTAEDARTADETEQLNTTKEDMMAAKASADDLNASRWARNSYGQAQQKETAAAKTPEYLEAIKWYTEARVLYAAAADETERLGEALAASEKAAGEMRAKAGTEEVNQYASVELGEADKLFASANDADADFIQARALYEQAEGKYTEALRLARERRREKTSQAETSNRLQADIESLITRYLNVRDGEELKGIFSDLFGSSVDYYDGGIVARETILKDKLQYYKRWPVRQMRLASEIHIQTGAMPSVYDVSYDIFFEVWSPEKNSGIKGKATNTMRVQQQQGKLKIIAEKQKILERTTLSAR
ncbi:MAG: hypothetical protein BWY09_01479 [Candidatus Hydrogenedentes bacterium ADurb.Bin179]|nr:MAG: hypothetical protein BWY09_01479 [Candidatus Hydrogenedentes bacterium ADurb.Bin179]